MYLIYEKSSGDVWRQVDIFVREPGQIRAGVDGQLTLIYPDGVNADIFELPDEDYYALDTANITKYLVKDGAVVVDPNWVDPSSDSEMMKVRLMDAVNDGSITEEVYTRIVGESLNQ